MNAAIQSLVVNMGKFSKWIGRLLFGKLSPREGWLILACVAIEVYISMHAIKIFRLAEKVHGSVDNATAANEINLMALGLILVSLIVGFCVNVSARFWTTLFFVVNLAFWCLAIRFGDGGGFAGFFQTICHW